MFSVYMFCKQYICFIYINKYYADMPVLPAMKPGMITAMDTVNLKTVSMDDTTSVIFISEKP